MNNDSIFVQELTSASRSEFFQDLASNGKYANIVAIYRHNDSVSAIGLFDEELINKLPTSVKYICHNGAGYDQSTFIVFATHAKAYSP